MNTLTERKDFLEALIRDVRQELIVQVISTISLKDNAFDNIVTDADVAVQERLVRALQDRFPDTAFLNEEASQHVMSDRMWIIDPIDGTKNFVRRQEDYAISVAYYENRQPVLGMVMDVEKNLLYVGIEHHGAWINGTPIAKTVNRPLQQSVVDVNLKTLDVLRSAHQAQVFALSRTVFAHRSIGSGALSLCRIAAGKHDVYLGDHIALWDYAAGAIVLRAAGGCVRYPFESTDGPEPAPRFVAAAAHPDQLSAVFNALGLSV